MRQNEKNLIPIFSIYMQMTSLSERHHYKKGLIHYLYGTGSGKSSSSFGIVLRAIGHNMTPVIIQFLKKSQIESEKYSEIEELKKLTLDISDLIEEYYSEENSKDPIQKGDQNDNKGFDYGEYFTFTEKLNVPMIQLGTPRFIFTGEKPTPEHIRKSEFGLKLINRIFQSDEYDLVVLDEIITAIHLKIVNLQEFLKILQNRKKNIEVILTGRERILELVEISDYVIQITAEKHPFQKGIFARKGVEF